MKISRATIIQFFERYNVLPIGACLLLATLLWFHVTGTRTGEVNMKVQLQVKNLAEDLIISDMDTRYVSVLVRGDREDLKSINRKSINAYIDLSRPVIGEPVKYPVRLTTPVMPDDIEFSLYDKSVFVKVEHKITKNVQVVPLIEGALKGSYLMGNVRVEPKMVSITGPESLVREYDTVETEVISIKNAQAPVTATAAIKQSGLKGLEVGPSSVKVFIPIYNAENIVRLRPLVKTHNVPEGLVFDIAVEKVFAYVRTTDGARNPEPADIEVYIDGEDLPAEIVKHDFSSSAEVEVRLPLRYKIATNPEMFTIVAVVPDRARVTISKK